MSNSPEELQSVLVKHYGIEAVSISDLETFDLTDVKVYDHYPEKYRTENYGYFELQNFKASEDELYKLVICSQNFPLNENLVTAMKDEEYLDVKDYELVDPVHPISGYFLYKLIPYTVQGKPVWS